MEENSIKAYYDDKVDLFARLGRNLEEAFRQFLMKRKIAFHNVNFRVKEFDSFSEKIERKGYNDPQKQIEDLLGIRIICYYANDLDLIEKLIQEEFDVKEALDKVDTLESDRFGYRSFHYIITIKKEWCNAPNYRDLNDLKVEVQVRTILMHAWADIEHKLAYKSQDQIAPQFRRKLSQLSALLEIADQQFQNLKDERESFKASLVTEKNQKRSFAFNVELNLDTLQAYLDFTFPKLSRNSNQTSQLLDELLLYRITIAEIDGYYRKIQNDFHNLNTELANGSLGQSGAVRALLDIFNDNYYKARHRSDSLSTWGSVTGKWKKRFNKQK